jgi:5-methylcytosine-specific restriction protein A
MIGRRINQALNLGAQHSLFRSKGDFYQRLTDFPGILIDLEGYIEFESQEEIEANPNVQRTERIHIPGGISSLASYIYFTEEQLFIVNQNLDSDSADPANLDNGNQAERRPRNIDSIVRNQALVRKVKGLRNNTCQICDFQLQIGPSSYYSEVHHIMPLGNPHNGQDILSNMICLCPNCHKKLDYGFVRIEIDFEDLPEHTIDPQFIQYHNNRIQKTPPNTV